MIVNRTYKVRIYPNKEQEKSLNMIIGSCRYVYNYYLQKKKEYYIENKKTLSYLKISKDLTQFRYSIDWLSNIQITPLQQSIRRLDVSYNRFFRKQSKFPRFKSKRDINQSFQKPKDWRIIDNKIQIQKDLVIKFMGNIDKNAKLGTLVILKKSSGKWFASITAKIEHKQAEKFTVPIGIDVGITTLATLSNGKKYKNIKPQESLQRKLRITQRILAKKKIGSKRREIARKKVAVIYEKIRNVRENYLHQVSHDIVSKNHAIIAVEDLNVNGMIKNRHLSRSLSDVSFREFLRQIEYKQKWNGGEFIKIDRFFPSSKTCSFCNFIVDTLPLSVRKWNCPKCSKTHDRDINASINILKQAVSYTERGEAR